MDFSEALTQVKRGVKVARSGWNGKGMFLFLVDAAWLSYSNEMEAEFADFIAIQSADGKVYPWFASQADLLAKDWSLTVQ